MTHSDWRRRVATLRQRALAGDLDAARDLGLDLWDGIRDRRGRLLLRRNARLGFAFLMQAAKGGDTLSYFAVGCAYDLGQGTALNKREALRWYRRAVRAGESIAAANIATVYRDQRKLRLASRWWKRSAGMGNGDALVDVGYCYLNGIGTGRHVSYARRFFRRAVSSGHITAYGREEAMYHLATSYLDAGMKDAAKPLLTRAAIDGDFPQAALLLDRVRSGSKCTPCRCRRFWPRQVPGQAACPAHPRFARRPAGQGREAAG